MTHSRTHYKPLIPSATLILQYLQDEGRKRQLDLINELNLPVRSIRYGIRILIERGYVVRIPNLIDMRSVIYDINPEIANVNIIIEEDLATFA